MKVEAGRVLTLSIDISRKVEPANTIRHTANSTIENTSTLSIFLNATPRFSSFSITTTFDLTTESNTTLATATRQPAAIEPANWPMLLAPSTAKGDTKVANPNTTDNASTHIHVLRNILAKLVL